MTGLFALSGSITNSLAIHMLFEKIPFFYGSGIIPLNFERIKIDLKTVIIDHFFSENQIDVFLDENLLRTEENIKQTLDSEKVFQSLVDAIEESSLGSMLSMLGGRKALDPLREPIKTKLNSVVDEFFQKENKNKVADPKHLKNSIEKLIEGRLNELKPDEVKKIIKDMIDKHLGWLVVWGGVFGGLIGFFSTLTITNISIL
tara:strand:- start:231 stop:836 length:606 start_codon:yes stop_codon:yes gene_type:complete